MEPISIPGNLDSLAPIRDYVDRAVSMAGLEKKAGYRLRLAVDEIATNIVTHGYQEAGREGDIQLHAVIDDATLTISLEDTGPPYDPTSADRPDDLDQPLEDRAIGGLGIFLTVNGVDDFRYQRVLDRNRNIFVMNRPNSSDAQGSA